MKRILSFTLFSVIAIVSYTQTKNYIDQPYLETMGIADTLVTPDRIYLSIVLTEKDTKGKVSLEELENRMDNKLTELGIDTKKQLTLSDLSSNHRKYILKHRDILKSKAYTLLLYDAVTAGKAIVGLEESKIANIHMGKMEYSKADELLLKLRSKAVAKAKAQAIAMTIPLNQKIGVALYISDNKQVSSMIQRSGSLRDVSSSSSKSKFKPIAIEVDKIKLISVVSVKFKLEE